MSISKKQKTFQAPKGMHDILPEDQKYWRYILKKAESLLEDYGFEKISTPIVESTDLFLRSVGEATDIIDKEIYSFKSKGGDELTLRPEGTAPVVRAYLENGMQVRPHPVKLYYVEPMFRHDQPQQGRYRQFHQLGIETLGDSSEAVDAELLFLAYKILNSIGLEGYNVHVNSIGDANCRPGYLRALKDYYKSRAKKVCENCRERMKENILRVLDCKEEGCQEVMKEAPQIMDFLDQECKNHFKHVLEFLDEAKIPYILNPHLVRGLDYYTRTVFEFLPEENATSQSTVLAGGRYDKLVEMLGGPKTPAAGWAMGLERLVLALKEKNINVPEIGLKPKVFLSQLGEVAKRKSLILYEEIRKAGIEIKSSLGRDSIKAQLRIANRLGVKFALIFGQKEALDNTVILREMDAGVQETIPLEKIVDELKKRLKPANK
ncbi:MAG: histidine--tRNA ligase [Candidatus Yanofskybacteria bacterium]|nr:histidine--tRNA ligase [Candidatus Yanofskybacteria bacterium]